MLNHVTDAKRREALASVTEGRLYDLGHVLHEEIPVFPGRFFRQTLVTTAHHANATEMVGENDVNWITEQVSATMQLGTHLDALSHLQIGDRGYNGWTVAELAGTTGVKRLGIETVPQIVTRGLLADVSAVRSSPGDVITVGDTFGWVQSMNARFIAVATRDGREVLIPNEDLVTQRVTSWSYTKDDIRVDVQFSVDVAGNPHAVRRIATEAAASVPRVLEKPPPACHFVAFGAHSLDFLLRFWINDPADGVANIRGMVLLALWDALKREKIEFPSPVQELRLRQSAHVVVDNPDHERSRRARESRSS
jgi:hypothetical protein